jgi:hypothetical protein
MRRGGIVCHPRWTHISPPSMGLTWRPLTAVLFPTLGLVHHPQSIPQSFILSNIFPRWILLNVSVGPAECFRRWCSFRSQCISPLHQKFPLPLSYSSLEVSITCPEFSPAIWWWTWKATYRHFMPNHFAPREMWTSSSLPNLALVCHPFLLTFWHMMSCRTFIFSSWLTQSKRWWWVIKVDAKSQSDTYLGMKGVARDHNEKTHGVDLEQTTWDGQKREVVEEAAVR